MVILMAIIVTPARVVAAVYLHEYAGKNSLTKIIRIAVINLAGCPPSSTACLAWAFCLHPGAASTASSTRKPAEPDLRLPWCHLVGPDPGHPDPAGGDRLHRRGLAGSRAPFARVRWRWVPPSRDPLAHRAAMASPAIMTGLITGDCPCGGRGGATDAGGVVKLAPTLPMDGNFPYLHVGASSCTFGFHIFDVGFQSPNVEAARPLVYATSFLLVTVIVGLNLTAIGIRNHLREKFRSLEH